MVLGTADINSDQMKQGWSTSWVLGIVGHYSQMWHPNVEFQLLSIPGDFSWTADQVLVVVSCFSFLFQGRLVPDICLVICQALLCLSSITCPFLLNSLSIFYIYNVPNVYLLFKALSVVFICSCVPSSLIFISKIYFISNAFLTSVTSFPRFFCFDLDCSLISCITFLTF